jgi:hypothetical protein
MYTNNTRKDETSQDASQRLRAIFTFIVSFVFQSLLQNGISYIHQTTKSYTYLKASPTTRALGALLLVPCLFLMVLAIAVFVVAIIALCLGLLALVAGCIFLFLLFSLLLHGAQWAGRKLHAWWLQRKKPASAAGTSTAGDSEEAGRATTDSPHRRGATHKARATRVTPPPTGQAANLKHRYKRHPAIPGRPLRKVRVPASAAT